MTLPTKSLAAATALAFLLSTGVAFAEDGGGGQSGPGMMGGERGPGRPQMMGSTSGQRPMKEGSSTWEGQGPRMGSSTGMMPHGIPGVVASVGTNSFTMDTRGMDKQGTTTFTVTVTDSTKYLKGPMGIGEGMKTGWSQQGGGDMHGQGQGSSSEHMMQGEQQGAPSGENASGTPHEKSQGQGRPNFFQQIKSFFNFFGSKNKGDQGAAAGSAVGMQQNGQQGGQQGGGQQMGTPATFADVTVGAHVEVIGKVATSTKTITAERVIIAGAKPTKPTKTDDGQLPQGTDDGQQSGGGQQAGGPAAAGSIWDFLFGWLH